MHPKTANIYYFCGVKPDTKHIVETFAQLGQRLASFGSDKPSEEVIGRAIAANDWFSRDDIVGAVEAIRTQMVDQKLLTQWVEQYEIPTPSQPLNVGIVMAGNIPLVGFFDLLCVVVSGNRAVIKPSSKDNVLMDYVLGELESIDPQIEIVPYDESVQFDAVIATGSDNTNRYFRAKYGNIKTLLRGSRTSAAVLRADQPDGDLRRLAEDIFTYSGLGCRNVSTIFVPQCFDIERLVVVLSEYKNANPKYRNNYTQQRALKIMSGEQFVDGGFFTLTEGCESSTNLSDIRYSFYDSLEDVERWLVENDSSVQCVVGDSVAHPRAVGFGSAQSPTLNDYPDGVDVMEFLIKL